MILRTAIPATTLQESRVKTYRIAVVGCRGRGSAAARAYHQHPRAEVVAVCDLLPEPRQALADELGVVARYADLDAMLAEVGPDVAVVATGTEFHFDLASRCLSRGVHLDVEKPICTELDQADTLRRLARDRSLRIAVHHQGRVGASMRAVRRAIAAGRIGAVRYLHGSGKGYHGGYGLMNIGTHTVNNMLGVAGHCLGVSAAVLTDGRQVTPADAVEGAGGMGLVAGEQITAVLEFASGVTGVLVEHRFPRVDSAAYQLEVFGTEGRLLWKLGQAWFLPSPHFVPGGAAWEPLELTPLPGFTPGRADEADYAYADDLVRALDEGRDPECSGGEGTHVLEVLIGILESGALGRRVALPQADRTHPLRRWRAEAGLPPAGPVPRGYGEWLAAEDRRLGRQAG
jgi:predicted dehydrogenase